MARTGTRGRPKVVEIGREELRSVRGGSSYAVGRSPVDFVKQIINVQTQTQFGV